MRNIFIIGILLFMLFKVYEERGEAFKNLQPHKEKKLEKVAEQQQEPPKLKEQIDQPKHEEQVQHVSVEQQPEQKNEPKQTDNKAEKSDERNYAYKPSGFLERVITNVVSDFVSTQEGKEIAKSMLTPRDPEMFNQSFAFSTSGLELSKRKYELKTVLNSSATKTICGQKIKLQYQIFNIKNNQIESKVEEYILGKHKIPEFNEIPEGMALNEVVAGKYLTGDAKANDPLEKGQKITLSVLEHITKLSFDTSKVKIYDDYISTSEGVKCEDEVKVQYHIFSVSGESIKSGEVTMRLGDFNYPQVMTYALNRMPLLGTRTVLLPQSYLALSKSNPLIKTANNNYVIMELSKVFVYPKEIK